MTGRGLVEQLRKNYLADDAGDETSFFWNTTELLAAINRTIEEIARRTLLIHDSTTPEICRIPLVPVEGIYPRTVTIDSRILRIDRVKFPGRDLPLTRYALEELDRGDPGWEGMSGTPIGYVPNLSNRTITLSRQPVSGGNVTLTVRRLPLAPLTLGSELEIPLYDEIVLYGAAARAYRKQDAETIDPQAAERYRTLFEQGIEQIRRDEAQRNPDHAVMRPEVW